MAARLHSSQRSQILAQMLQSIQHGLHTVDARKHQPIKVRQTSDRRIDSGPILRLADFNRRLQQDPSSQFRQGTSQILCLMGRARDQHRLAKERAAFKPGASRSEGPPRPQNDDDRAAATAWPEPDAA